VGRAQMSQLHATRPVDWSSLANFIMAFTYPTPRSPLTDRTWWREQAGAAAPALLTLVLATTVCLLGWRGVDQAAQFYRVTEFKTHGLTLWDSGWYGGNFPLGYSVLFPVIGAVLGIKVASVAAAVLATWAFDRVVTSYFGSRPLGTWYFAVSTLLPVTIGQLPFLTGEAFGLSALVALRKGRRSLALILGLLAALCSPLAAAFLAMVCLAWAGYGPGRRVWLIATAAVSLTVILVIGVLFPGTGPFPFPWQGLAITEALCLTALTPLVQTTPAVRLGALLYAAASFFSFLVPNPLGGNAPRLAATIGVPLLACFLTAPGPAMARLSPARLVSRLTGGRVIELGPRWRIAAVVMVVPFAVWQWAPGGSVVTSPSSHPELQQSFYQPLLQELALRAPEPIRVEVPPTLEHWEAAFLAPHISLARGWERQLDIADNPLFYTPGALTASSYKTWLDTNGITWVALPSAPLDYASQGEARLLESGQVAGLDLVWQTPDWRLWRVDGSPGLVSGPASLTSVEPDHLILQVSQPGPITVRVHYTEFWTVTTGAACLSPAPGGWTAIDAVTTGSMELSASVLHPAAPAYCSTR
jgi:hypothetical protein